MKSKKIRLLLISLLLISGLTLLLYRYGSPIKEAVRKQTTQILKTEYIPSQPDSLKHELALTQTDSIYLDFRKGFPYHYQTIGVANFSDSSRMILISDPPPYLKIDSIQKIFSQFTHRVETKLHKIGYDGYAKDIVIQIANATTENMDKRIKQLSELLFFSDYKPAVMPLPIQQKRIFFAENSLDYQISLYEFNQWFLEDQEPFINLKDTTQEYTIQTLFKNDKGGVYFSKEPGFVAWVIPKKSDLDKYKQHIRQFTLDADLILGALADTATLVIIGRERESSLEELPPLQVETILLLASITEKELSQSLDVNDFLAGKMNNGRDWCPTYLSKELEHTEFGSLMTLTDILLKDWSEKGTIREYNYRYPHPSYYPFKEPLFRMLGLNELVYNWNTANALFAIDMEPATIYTLNRTGSLPVSYFNSPESGRSIGRSYENKAYSYFATVGNTDLARVVQYTALYQLFMDNEITYKGEITHYYPKNKAYLLSQPVRSFLDILKNLSEAEMKLVTDSVVERKFWGFHKGKIEEQIQAQEKKHNFTYTDQQREDVFERFRVNETNHILKQFRSVKRLLNQLSDADFKYVVLLLSYPRGERINSQSQYQLLLHSRKIKDLLNMVGKNNLDLFGLNLEQVKNFFSNSLIKSSAPYLKTPSLIITYNDLYTTGGHNISSKITRVKSLTNYKPSQQTKAEKGTVDREEPATAAKPRSTSTPQKDKNQTKTTKKTTQSKGSSKATPASSSIRKRGDVVPAKKRTQRGF